MKIFVVVAAASCGFALGLALPSVASSQTPRAASVADSSPFRALELPAPNAYRSGSGRPGPSYWQQRADYRINATLDPARNEIRAREGIHYTNHSPDALPYLWLYLEQNICAPGSVTNLLNQPPLAFLGSSFDFSCQGFNGGVTVDAVRVDGTESHGELFGTTMRIDLPVPLRTGASVELEFGWHFNVPPQGAGRMGHDGDRKSVV